MGLHMNFQLNHLLAALSPAFQNRIFSHLDLVQQRLGDVLYESDDTLRNVHFPLDGIVSLLYVTRSGSLVVCAAAMWSDRQEAGREV